MPGKENEKKQITIRVDNELLAEARAQAEQAGTGFALIGNGARSSDVTGAVTGDIDLHIGGTLFMNSTPSATAWLGNSVTGSGSNYTVTATTGTGTGTLGLKLVDNDSIFDIDNMPLGGTGAGNGNFTGQVYTIDRTTTTVAG